MKNLHLIAFFIVIMLVSPGCLDVKLTQNKIYFSKALNGIWNSDDDSDIYELVRVNGSLIHIYELGERSSNPLYKLSISKVGGLMFASLIDEDKDVSTLFVKKLTSNQIILSFFSIVGIDDDEFDRLKLSNKEMVFNALVEKNGIIETDLKLVYNKTYEPVVAP